LPAWAVCLHWFVFPPGFLLTRCNLINASAILIRVQTEKQAAAVAKNLDLVLKGKQPVAYKSDGDRTFPLPLLYTLFSHFTAMLAVALGRSRGTGRFGNMKLPSLVVWLVSKLLPSHPGSNAVLYADIVTEGRNMGMPKQSGLVMGTAF
jgi:hypothetical protein